MLNYLKRRISSTDLINEIRSGVIGYGNQNTQQQPQSQPRPTEEYKYLPEEMRKTTTVEEIYTQKGAEVGQRSQHTRVSFPSAPSSPTRRSSSSTSASGGGFFSSVTGQLTKAKHLFSSEALNSIIGDTKQSSNVDEERCKILLVIDHSLTDWSKCLLKRKLEGDWEVRVEQAQFNDISIVAYPDQGCIVTVQDSRGGRSPRSFKPDFVLIRQGMGATTQHYENLITGLMFGGVPCLNSIDAIYNMRNKAWLFCHLLQLQRRLGAAEFPLISRSFQTKSQPQTPDFPIPVTVRLGGDTARECEIKVKDVILFQSMMLLANNTQRYATTEPCLQIICEIIIQKIGPHLKAFTRKSISSNTIESPGSTVLEKIPVAPRFNRWISEVAELFGGLEMCAIKAVQDTTGDYHIQDVFGSEFVLLGDGQEEDRTHIAELLLQRMEQVFKGSAHVPRTTSQTQITPQPPVSVTMQRPAPPSQQQISSPDFAASTRTLEQLSRQSQLPPQLPSNRFDRNQQPPKQDIVQSKISAGSMDFSSPSRPQDQPKVSTSPQDRKFMQVESGVSMDFGSGLEIQGQQHRYMGQSSSESPQTGSNETVGVMTYQQPPNTFSPTTDVKSKPLLPSFMASSTKTSTHPIQKQDPVTSVYDPPHQRAGFEQDVNRCRPSRESSIDSVTGQSRSRPYKEVAPQPPQQSSATNSNAIGLGRDPNYADATSIFDPSMNIFAPTSTATQSRAPSSAFKGQLQTTTAQSSDTERIGDTFGAMSFQNSAMDLGTSTPKTPINDPWSVQAPIQPPMVPVQKYQQQIPRSRDMGGGPIGIPPRGTSLLSSAVLGDASQGPEDADDTMKHLRKTFAGIFGDI